MAVGPPVREQRFGRVAPGQRPAVFIMPDGGPERALQHYKGDIFLSTLIHKPASPPSDYAERHLGTSVLTPIPFVLRVLILKGSARSPVRQVGRLVRVYTRTYDKKIVKPYKFTFAVGGKQRIAAEGFLHEEILNELKKLRLRSVTNQVEAITRSLRDVMQELEDLKKTIERGTEL